MPWLTILKYGLPVLAVAALLGITYRAGSRAATAQCQITIDKMNASLSSLAAQQQEKNREAERQMDADRQAREALSVELGARVDSYAGLAVRLRDALAAARPRPVPAAGGGPGPAAAGPQGDCSAGRLTDAVQQAFTACRSDAIALQVLGSRPLCECATSAVPR